MDKMKGRKRSLSQSLGKAGSGHPDETADLGKVTFQFSHSGSTRVTPVADLQRGASPGWLRVALEQAVETGEAVRVPEDMPIANIVEVRAFEKLLTLAGAGCSKLVVKEMFAKPADLRLLPHAFQVAHLLGMEESCSALRSRYLEDPSAVLRSLKPKQADLSVLQNALRLGLGHSTRSNAHKMPLRPSDVSRAETQEAIELAVESALGSRGCTPPTTESCQRALAEARWHFLLELFRAAVELGMDSLKSEVRGALTQDSNLAMLLGASAQSAAVKQSLLFALKHGLDRRCALRALHVACLRGVVAGVELAVEAGQGVNIMDSQGRSSALMCAAAGGTPRCD
mmetsp:Transcript_24050/g.55888  ORF Transcript_24050/g.55888 Transcript_24050/m.55888 type:complete len:341 (+) Transcript_24050:187-1209(+)